MTLTNPSTHDMVEKELQGRTGRAHRRGRVAVHLLHAQQVRPHLRLVERGRITFGALGQLAQVTVILVPRGGGEAAQGQRFVEPAQGVMEENARRRSARGLTGGFVRGHSPRALPATPAPSTLPSLPSTRDTHVTHRRASGLVQPNIWTSIRLGS